MHSSGMDLWLNHWPQPCSWLKKIKLDYGTNYVEKFGRDVHQDSSSIGYWDFVEESHACGPSFLTILILLYSLPKISTNKNPRTDQYLTDGTWCCVWGAVANTLMLGSNALRHASWWTALWLLGKNLTSLSEAAQKYFHVSSFLIVFSIHKHDSILLIWQDAHTRA